MNTPNKQTIGQLCKCRHARKLHINNGRCLKCKCKEFDYLKDWRLDKSKPIKKKDNYFTGLNLGYNQGKQEGRTQAIAEEIEFLKLLKGNAKFHNYFGCLDMILERLAKLQKETK